MVGPSDSHVASLHGTIGSNASSLDKKKIDAWKNGKKSQTHSTDDISRATVNMLLFGRDAKPDRCVLECESMEAGGYITTIIWYAEGDGALPVGDKGGVPPCLRRPLKPISLRGSRTM